MSEDTSMMEVFIYESDQLLESLEDILLQGEKEHELNPEHINEVFRVMHTLKGSSSMMGYDSLAKLAHATEDLFAQIREKGASKDDWAAIFDLVLEANDALKAHVNVIHEGKTPNFDNTDLINRLHACLENLKTGLPASGGAAAGSDTGSGGTALDEQGAGTVIDGALADDPEALYYRIKATFEEGCLMENLRAFSLVNELLPCVIKMCTIPDDLESATAADYIIANGFTVFLKSTENPDKLKSIANGVMFVNTASILSLEDMELVPENLAPVKAAPEPAEVAVVAELPEASAAALNSAPAAAAKPAAQAAVSESIAKQNFISVNVNKLDKLVDLVGEIVTNESMVTKNPEIASLQIQGFDRASQELHKLINELQDIVMSIRMVPVASTFHKMQRIVRDMSKKVQKTVNLVILGEETEVDKNIIDTLSDPLMHLIRNAVDHGLETTDVRKKKGKDATGRVTLEARNTGGDVIIIVEDDGGGLDRGRIIKKAQDKGLITKPENEISDKEAYQLIFAPGLSTNEQVTEFSGRGVGMDVVRSNIDKVGGSISVDSAQDKGTTITIRIPLTLSIIEGMKLRVGQYIFIVPMLSIQESSKEYAKDVFLDPNGNEMLMIRGSVYPVVRLYNLFNLEPEKTELSEGILIMINSERRTYCLFVDELIGEQQAVIKPLPTYIQKHNNGMHGLSGCSILGDGSISLIIDINKLLVD
ncbi:MAG: chemotaxis protein CheA [Oscillospiraceae bacterium]|jgi:two-component system chemotaxis sensor kinase CheA|nr:chemotaxis protein CheA [Oscillospiraceae bacterium]